MENRPNRRNSRAIRCAIRARRDRRSGGDRLGRIGMELQKLADDDVGIEADGVGVGPNARAATVPASRATMAPGTRGTKRMVNSMIARVESDSAAACGEIPDAFAASILNRAMNSPGTFATASPKKSLS